MMIPQVTHISISHYPPESGWLATMMRRCAPPTTLVTLLTRVRVVGHHDAPVRLLYPLLRRSLPQAQDQRGLSPVHLGLEATLCTVRGGRGGGGKEDRVGGRELTALVQLTEPQAGRD